MKLRKRGSVWFVDYRACGVRHRQSTGTGDKKKAMLWMQQIDLARRMPSFEAAVDVLRQFYQKPPKGKIPLGLAFEQYAELAAATGKEISKLGLERRRNIVRRFVKWAAKNRPTAQTVESVTGPIAAAFAAHLAAEGLKTKTRINVIGELSSVWKMLEKASADIRNPWANLAPRDTDGEVGKAFTAAQEAAVLAAAEKVGKQWREVSEVMRLTGMRYGDVARLTWAEVGADALRLAPHKTRTHKIAVDPSTAKRMSWSTRAGVGNTAFLESIDGATIRTVDTSASTNSVQYDAFKRQVATTDGRGNTTSYVYDELGRMSRQIDPCGNETAYVYDMMGRIVEVTNALGNVTFTRYDLRGNKTYEGGATYPVSYAYDAFGNRTSMTTYRNEMSTEGDTTNWIYDEATGLVTQKLYADGHGPSYTYMPDGKLATRTWARGIVTNYGYDTWGNLTSTTYSDGTPSVTLSYDALSRKSSVSDAAGVTSFVYDSYGNLASERWGGLGNRVLTRHYDAYGRNVGYSVNGARKTTIGYDFATGRIAMMYEGGNFAWQYLAGSHLKSRVSYPNGITVDYSYELNRDLLTEVRNYRGSIEYSRYLYANDALGRRTARNGEEYGYNNRNELTSAVGNGSYQYSYDDIGNREQSIEPTQTYEYEANELNQYTQIAEAGIDTEVPFGPVYDVDGNQTLVKTSTGIWHVEYNGENRPIRWTRANTVITMDFDSMGRRTFYRETENGRQVTFTRFFYDGYLLIQQLFSNAPYNVYKEFIWDPTEQIATKPLCFRQNGQVSTFLTHDGNKNVTDVIRVGPYNDSVGHYDYAPFGAVHSQTGARATANPFRFSSEFSDDTLGLVYYNYRHYEPITGRWCSRDLLGEDRVRNLMGYCSNAPLRCFDYLGNSWLDFSPGEPPADVGPVEGFIPVYGSLREFDNAVYDGEWGMATFHLLMAVSDVFLVKSMINVAGKGCWKVGSHSWSATRRWYASRYGVEKGVEIHHMYIPQKFIRKHSWVAAIANQPWNLKVIEGTADLSAKRLHLAVHGCRVVSSSSSIRVELSLIEQYWYRYYSTGMMTGSLYFADDIRFVMSIIRTGQEQETNVGGFDSPSDAYDDALRVVGDEMTDAFLGW